MEIADKIKVNMLHLSRGVLETNNPKGIEFDNFFAEISSWTRLPLYEHARGRPLNQSNKQPVELSEILAELLLKRDILIQLPS